MTTLEREAVSHVKDKISYEGMESGLAKDLKAFDVATYEISIPLQLSYIGIEKNLLVEGLGMEQTEVKNFILGLRETGFIRTNSSDLEDSPRVLDQENIRLVKVFQYTAQQMSGFAEAVRENPEDTAEGLALQASKLLGKNELANTLLHNMQIEQSDFQLGYRQFSKNLSRLYQLWGMSSYWKKFSFQESQAEETPQINQSELDSLDNLVEIFDKPNGVSEPSGETLDEPVSLISLDKKLEEIVDDSLAERLLEKKEAIETDGSGVFKKRRIRSLIRTFFPNTAQSRIDSTLDYLIQRRDIPPLEVNGELLYSQDQLLALVSVIHHYLQNDNSYTRVDALFKKSQQSWQEGGAIHEIFSAIVDQQERSNTLKSEKRKEKKDRGEKGTEKPLKRRVSTGGVSQRSGTESNSQAFLEEKREAIVFDSKAQPLSQSSGMKVTQNAGKTRHQGRGYVSQPSSHDTYKADAEQLQKIGSNRYVRRLRGESTEPVNEDEEELQKISKAPRVVQLSSKETSLVYELILDNDEREYGDPNIPPGLLKCLRNWDLRELHALINSFTSVLSEEGDRVIDVFKEIDYPSLVSMEYVTVVGLQRAGHNIGMNLKERKRQISSFLPYLKHVRSMMETMATQRKLKPNEVNQLMVYQSIRALEVASSEG